MAHARLAAVKNHKLPLLLIASIVAATSLSGCKRSLDEADVREFIDKADEKARKRYAPEICELRGENFKLRRTLQALDEHIPPSEIEIDRKLFCREASLFSKVRQYKLERTSLDIDVAEDGKTAKAIANYVETLPYYEPDTMPATPDDFREFQIIESHDESMVGIEGGDVVFLSTDTESRQTELVPKAEISLPYD
jgi:hypothetical protein